MQNNNNKDLGSALELLKQELLGYLNKRLKWTSLLYQERGSKLFAVLLYGLLLLSVVFIILFFSLIGLALFIGYLLDKPFLGFLVLSLFAVVVLVITILLRNKIKNYILNKSISILQGIGNDDDGDNSLEEDEE